MVTMQMNGRIEALKSQYESGMSGQPAFPGATPPSSGAKPSTPTPPPGANQTSGDTAVDNFLVNFGKVK
jgi:hypothetical protein